MPSLFLCLLSMGDKSVGFVADEGHDHGVHCVALEGVFQRGGGLTVEEKHDQVEAELDK
jgi:hypothetical protein